MSRIRSVHPGFFTDEDLVSVSIAARMLVIGLGVESDDKGVFEWKPVTLKMRIFPADNLDVAELLAELEHVGAIMPYEMDGKKYGAIRNFRKFQRPKTPNNVHPANDNVLIFVGMKPTGHAPISPSGGNEGSLPMSDFGNATPLSEADWGNWQGSPPDNGEAFPPKGEMDGVNEPPFPPKGEKPIQMEDGGGRKKNTLSNESGENAVPMDPEKRFWADAKAYLSSVSRNPGALIGKWHKDHDREAIKNAITRAQLEQAIDPLAFIIGCLRQSRNDDPYRFDGPC